MEWSATFKKFSHQTLEKNIFLSIKNYRKMKNSKINNYSEHCI